MNKVYGLKTEFAYFREDGGRYVIGYGMESVDKKHATWYEVYYYKKQHPNISLQDIKDGILGDIDKDTDEKILTGFVWTVPKTGGEPETLNAWLNSENQFNYKAAFDLAYQTNGANLPVVFKFGIPEAPVYHTFSEMTELQDFYTSAVRYINATLADGWARKDAIDWQPYEELFPQPTPPNE